MSKKFLLFFVFFSLFIFSRTDFASAALPNPVLNTPNTVATPLNTIIDWDIVTGATYYNYSYWPSISPSEIVSGSAVSPDVNITSLNSCADYKWNVQAFSATDSSAVIEASFKTVCPPASPGLVDPKQSATEIILEQIGSDIFLNFYWEPPITSAENVDVELYTFQYRKDLESYKDFFTLAATGTRVTATSFEPCIKYYWQVKSCGDVNEDGGIDPNTECGSPAERSFEFKIYTPTGTLSIVSSNYPVQFSWNPVVGAKSYTVQPRIKEPSCGWNPFCWVIDFLKDLSNALHQSLSYLFPVDLSDDQLQKLASCPYILWDSDSKECDSIPSLTSTATYIDDTCIFQSGVTYTVRIQSCLDETASCCGDFGEKTNVSPSSIIRPPPDLIAPTTTKVVNMDDLLVWEAHDCVGFVRISVGGTKTTLPSQETISIGDLFAPNLPILQSSYTWKLEPCWRILTNVDCDNGNYSEERSFIMTGTPPSLSAPDNGMQLSTPISLEWNSADGAASYYYEIASTSGFSEVVKNGTTTATSTKIDYSGLMPDSEYWWHVRTCADLAGTFCGNFSGSRSFKTYPLSAPITLINPIDKGSTTLPTTLKWEKDPGANFYTYEVLYTTTTYDATIGLEEEIEGCADLIGTTIVPQPGDQAPIVDNPSGPLSATCLGGYELKVISCWDEKCETKSSNTAGFSFVAASRNYVPERGIVPCGRKTDNPSTYYNERERCQFKHLGFLAQNLLDFLMWRLSFLILILMIVVSVAIAYSSMGDPGLLAKIKMLWKSFGTGVAIVFLSWAIINLILAIFGYQTIFFGNWYEISL